MEIGRDGRLGRVLGLTVASCVVVALAGCTRDRPIRPFGSVHTNDFTVVPGPLGHPRGQMVPQQAPGIDLVGRPAGVVPTGVGGRPSDFDASARTAEAATTRE